MKILIIDDDPAMTDLFRMTLSSSQTTIYTSNTGREGVELARKCNPDIILLDLMMPEMDGWQVTTEIRKFTLAPVVIISAIDNPGLIAKALDAGADDFLVKPVPSSILLAHIRNLAWRQTTEVNSPASSVQVEIQPGN